MLCIYFFFDGIYTIDYKDRFLFLMLGIFFSPENVGNFHNTLEPGVFYGGRPNNIIGKIEKEKNTMVMLSFLSTLLFFYFVLTYSLFFILASVCRPSIHESILRGVHTLHIHLSNCIFCFSYKYRKQKD
jgi:hypothetical protein